MVCVCACTYCFSLIVLQSVELMCYRALNSCRAFDVSRWDAHVIDHQSDLVLVHYVGGTDEEDEWIHKRSDRLRFKMPKLTPRCTAMPEPNARMSMPPCGAFADEAACMMPQELDLAGNMGEACDEQLPSSPEIMLVGDELPELDLAAHVEEQDEQENCLDEEHVLPTTIDVVKANLGDMDEGLVELALNSSGRDLSFQWYEGNEAIPGANTNSLLLVNSGGVGGRIRCLVRNKYGATWIKCPVLLPAEPEQARQELDALNAPGFYRLACRCPALNLPACSPCCHYRPRPVMLSHQEGTRAAIGIYSICCLSLTGVCLVAAAGISGRDWRKSCARRPARVASCAVARLRKSSPSRSTRFLNTDCGLRQCARRSRRCVFLV